jgi:hypothetical protein
MKDLCDLSYFLEIEATWDDTSLHILQSKYIVDLIDLANIVGARPYNAPCVSSSKISKRDGHFLDDPLNIIKLLMPYNILPLHVLILFSQLVMSTYANSH